MTDPERFQPFQEPLRRTVLRTTLIAVGVGALLALRWGGGSQFLEHWPLASLMAFWPSFGGHWVEILFLNVLRPRLPGVRALHIALRLALWFGSGILFAHLMRLTARELGGFQPQHEPAWWVGGPTFIGVELIVHGVMRSRGVSNFYDGRG